MDDGHPVIKIFICILMLLIYAISKGFNVAVMSLSESELENKAEEGDKKAEKLLSYANKPSRFLNTVDMTSIASVLLIGLFIAGPISRRLIPELEAAMGLSHLPAAILGYGLLCLMVVTLVYLLGAMLPKRLAFKYAHGWAYVFLPLMGFLEVLCLPFVRISDIISLLFLRLFGITQKDLEENVTEEEIITLVSEGQEQGVIEDSEAEMITNILKFDDINVEEIMTHRKHIVGIDSQLSLAEAAQIMAHGSYSRYPVYEEDMDNIIGMLFLKDIMRCILAGDMDVKIRDIMRKPFFVPGTNRIDDVFEQMQSGKKHIAIVVDEYGQSCGIVTMEDILEEIVGNIFDEYDLEENNIQSIGNYYLIRGMTELDEIAEKLGIEFDDEFDILNGFLISRLEHIPMTGERAFVDHENYRFRIMAVKDNMISLVKVTKLGSQEVK